MKKINSTRLQKILAFCSVLIMATIGTALILGSHAASPYVSVDASTGAFSGGAVNQACPGSTSGNCAVFAGTQSGGGGTMKNCLQLQSDAIHPVYAALDACSYPSPNTTGVPAGLTLTTVSSNCNCLPPNTSWNNNQLAITGPTSISKLNIPGTIYFVASDFSNLANANVSIVDSKVSSPSTNGTVIDLQGAGHVSITYSQISGLYNGQVCSNPVSEDVSNGGLNNVLDHDYLSCAGEPVNGDFTLTNSYILIDGFPPGAHLEDIYIPPKGSGDIEKNTLLNPNNQTAVIFGNAKLGSLSNLTIKNNLMAIAGDNGNVAIGCAASGVPNDGFGFNTSTIVSGNRFSSVYTSSQYPFVTGNTDGGSGTSWTGNYMDANPSTIVSQPVNPC